MTRARERESPSGPSGIDDLVGRARGRLGGGMRPAARRDQGAGHGGRRRSALRRGALVLIVLAPWVAAPAASASEIVSPSTVSNLSLGVNGKGEAMLTYTANGKVVHVLAWGAINAVAPTPGGTQEMFQLARSRQGRRGAGVASLRIPDTANASGPQTQGWEQVQQLSE